MARQYLHAEHVEIAIAAVLKRVTVLGEKEEQSNVNINGETIC